MSKVSNGTLVFLAMLCLCSVVYAQSESKDDQDPEVIFNIQMNAALLNNDPKAQYKVAEMYEKGVGIPQDLRLAHLWYGKSANQHYAPAVEKLANWAREEREAESEARKQAEEQKRHQAEVEAAAAAKAARERAEEQKRHQAEVEAAAVKPVQNTDPTPVTKTKPPETDHSKDKIQGVTEKSAEKSNVEKSTTEFSANPCKTPTAKFTSTCQ